MYIEFAKLGLICNASLINLIAYLCFYSKINSADFFIFDIIIRNAWPLYLKGISFQINKDFCIIII